MKAAVGLDLLLLSAKDQHMNTLWHFPFASDLGLLVQHRVRLYNLNPICLGSGTQSQKVFGTQILIYIV